jgi:L-amino acid N-acyltransferase YncA
LVQLELTVTAGNSHACKLYERSGFVVWGQCPGAICVAGVYFDKVHMAKKLR